MPRNLYQKVSPKDKARLREMHQSGGNFVTLAKLLKINRNIEEEALGGTLPIKRLPKYSPFLNPIENAFSCWKSELKKNLAENMSIFLNPDNHGRDGMSLRDFRFLMMKREIEASSRIITSVKCQEWANHSMSYVPRCLREEDIS